jgi:hypothetical protein
MCRNIKPLFNFEPPATRGEIHASALQYVRKISGYHHPSKVNEAAFETAVEEVTAVINRLLQALETTAPPKDRDEEAQKARERSKDRYARLNAPA